jgi:hypothetical protein
MELVKRLGQKIRKLPKKAKILGSTLLAAGAIHSAATWYDPAVYYELRPQAQITPFKLKHANSGVAREIFLR